MYYRTPTIVTRIPWRALHKRVKYNLSAFLLPRDELLPPESSGGIFLVD